MAHRRKWNVIGRTKSLLIGVNSKWEKNYFNLGRIRRMK